ncbi:TetR family transcriptional regulator [Pseudofrankia sp. DC12]|uniref:TetR family transcriptional regulator n=1 Tax=Pseudofrankia sp. DC12 TaxID=683315 RepID=UPI0018DCB9B0|nr:TetR family transcriptional regulator [Pseudofrankia sp. DC12]
MPRAVIATDPATRNAVLSAAAECFVRHDVTRTTAADIARGAGISRVVEVERTRPDPDAYLAGPGHG